MITGTALAREASPRGAVCRPTDSPGTRRLPAGAGAVLRGSSLPRRTFLRGLGTAVALPFLDAMTPAFASASEPITRVAFIYTANGVIMSDWTPAETGAGFTFTKTLHSLEPFRDRLLVLTGLAHRNGEALGDGPGDHARAGASWLTGVHPRKTQGADIRNGMSVDQMLARDIGRSTPLPSLELGLQDVRMVGGCDSGYSCAYSNTVSWSSPTTPLPYETNPRRVFERLFGDGDTTDPGRCGRCARGRTAASSTSSARTRAGCGRASGPATAASSATTSTRCARSSAASRTSSAATTWTCRPSPGPTACPRPSRSTSGRCPTSSRSRSRRT